MGISVRVNSNVKEFTNELREKIPVALEKCGLVAEGYAKRLCPVDTGLLRNSITHALDGESPAISMYRASKGSNRSKSGKRISANSKNAGFVGVGFYSGSMPSEPGTTRAVYVGTNVEYAPYVEMGTSRTDAKPFIKPSIADHVNQYIKIIKSTLQE